MISDWVSNALSATIVPIPLSELEQSGLSGGDVAAIVIGSCVGAFVVSVVVAVLIKLLAQGCFAHAMMPTKMM